MRPFLFGRSAAGMPILGYELGYRGPRFLVLGGVHGNEPEGVIAAHGMIERFLAGYALGLRTTIVPVFNPDGVYAGERRNSNGVDLNRNLPTRDWSPKASLPKYCPGVRPGSEPESQSLIRYLDAERPALILSLHSWKPVLNVNGDCRRFAEAIAARTGYAIEGDIGYPTPGCLGTYAGIERNMPVLTYEIERGLDPSAVLGLHVPAILEALKSIEEWRA